MKIGLPKEYYDKGIDGEVKEMILDGVKVLERLCTCRRD